MNADDPGAARGGEVALVRVGRRACPNRKTGGGGGTQRRRGWGRGGGGALGPRPRPNLEVDSVNNNSGSVHTGIVNCLVSRSRVMHARSTE